MSSEVGDLRQFPIFLPLGERYVPSASSPPHDGGLRTLSLSRRAARSPQPPRRGGSCQPGPKRLSGNAAASSRRPHSAPSRGAAGLRWARLLPRSGGAAGLRWGPPAPQQPGAVPLPGHRLSAHWSLSRRPPRLLLSLRPAGIAHAGPGGREPCPPRRAEARPAASGPEASSRTPRPAPRLLVCGRGPASDPGGGAVPEAEVPAPRWAPAAARGRGPAELALCSERGTSCARMMRVTANTSFI